MSFLCLEKKREILPKAYINSQKCGNFSLTAFNTHYRLLLSLSFFCLAPNFYLL